MSYLLRLSRCGPHFLSNSAMELHSKFCFYTTKSYFFTWSNACNHSDSKSLTLVHNDSLQLLPSKVFNTCCHSKILPSDEASVQEIRSMLAQYAQLELKCAEISQPAHIDRDAVFVNNEVHLASVSVYGFDYDYTLATYSEALDYMIFQAARDLLVQKLGYPDSLLYMKYNPDFAIRGLHYDVKKGLLMKVDAYNNIQLDTVYRGLSRLSTQAVIAEYNGTYIPKPNLKNSPGLLGNVMSQLMDFFVLPETNLLCNLIEFFEMHNINYRPSNLYDDVSKAVREIHKSGHLHQTIMKSPDKYIVKNVHLRPFLQRLADNKKTLFLISNSGAKFIDHGMSYLVGKDWRQLFDIIIVNAQKPAFFTDKHSQFRLVDASGNHQHYDEVEQFTRGQFYVGGNLSALQNLTGWEASRVLYFGDHVYSDLADVANTQGWVTGAVVPELMREIDAINSQIFQSSIKRLNLLEQLIAANQALSSEGARVLLAQWFHERQVLRFRTKSCFNSHFGSIFRSFHNPSYYSMRIGQYAALYTASVTNLLRYPIDHMFFPRRVPLPHEPT